MGIKGNARSHESSEFLCGRRRLLRLLGLAGAAGLLAPLSAGAIGIDDDRSIRLDPLGNSRHAPVVTAIAIDPGGQFLAAAGDDHAIRILDLETLSPVQTLSAHSDWVRTLDFSPDGTLLVSAGNDGQVIFWDRGERWTQRQSLEGAPALACARFAPTGRTVAAVGFTSEIFVIGVGGAGRPALPCNCGDLRTLAFRHDGGVMAVGGRSGTVNLLDPRAHRWISDHPLHNSRIHALTFLPGSDVLVTAAEEGSAKVFDTRRGQLLHEITLEGCKLLAAAALDERYVALGGSDNRIHLLDTTSGGIVGALEGHRGSVVVLAAKESTLYSGSFDTTIRRWRLGKLTEGVERVAESDERLRTSRLPGQP